MSRLSYRIRPLADRDLDHHVQYCFERWLIFYIPADNTVQIVRVLHGARDLPTILAE